MDATAEKFACQGCKREMTWKPDFAGRRIKCKSCGQPMVIPSQPMQSEPEPVEDDLYALSDLATDAQTAAASIPVTIVDPVPVEAPKKSAKGAKPAISAKNAIPLAYQRPQTAAEKERAVNVHIDKTRDIHVPLILILVGAALYLGYYAIHYHLGGFAIVAISIGLVIMTILETAVLFGFGLAMAGPLGVGFGGIGTALLKFAAVAILCDGITTWVDGLFSAMTGGIGGGGIFGYGAIGLPIALGVYWVSLIYLFSLDPGDTWLFVVILSVFYRFLRIILLLLLLKFILSFGGVGASAISLPSVGGGGVATNPLIDEINQAEAQNVLHEAKQYVADNGRRAESDTVNAWYAAGARNVWFQTSHDIDGKGDAFRMVVELPDDPTARAKCYDIAKKYYTNNGESFMAQSLQDTGDPYLLVPLP